MTGAPTRPTRRGAMAALAAVGALVLTPAAVAQELPEDNALVVDGVLAYLGVLPAAIVRGHPRSHPEGAMHGGAPDGRHQVHVILALFDAASGERIGRATVALSVMGEGHLPADALALDPMEIADTVTWGGFVELPGRDLYELRFEVSLPGREAPIVFPFGYRHGGT